MKSLTLWKIKFFRFLSFACSAIFVSCSTENNNSQVIGDSNPTSANFQSKTGLYPENDLNIYDIAGQLHNEISESYLAAGLVSTTTNETILQVEAIANSNIEFKSLLPVEYISPTALQVDAILNDPDSIILNSTLSPKSKLSLTTFLDTLMVYQNLQVDYSVVYQFIIDYEASIISDELLSETDRKVILITTSISRYGFYFAAKHRRKPRDRDWEILWANIVAGTDGSKESIAKAIVLSTTCGIILNK